jgi:hypothetical protein
MMMGHIILRLSLILGSFLFPVWLFAASYYVDFTGGADTNNGTATTTPFKHCPGDTNATNTAASTTLTAGDFVYFKGGVTYSGQITLSWSGTSGSPITYDGNSAGTWGTGKAIINGSGGSYYGFYSGNSRDYLTINFFEITGQVVNTTAGWQNAGVYIDNDDDADSLGIIISNNYIHDLGYWICDCAGTGGFSGGAPSGVGIQCNNCTSALITGNTITKTGGGGFGSSGARSCTISNNSVYAYITWGIEINGDSRTTTNNTISGNTVYDLYHHDNGIRPVDSCDPHTDYIFIRQGSGQRPSGTLIERNLFYNNYDFSSVAAGGTAMIFLSFTDDTTIRNNVLINPHSYYAVSPNWQSTGVKIYNNTIYAPTVGGIYFGLTGTGGSYVKNNIIVQSSSGHVLYGADLTTEAGISESDYNLWITTASPFRFDPNWYSTAQWQAKGFDTHSLESATIAAIKFVSIAGYPTNSSSMDLRLQADSPAVNTGTTIAGFINDYAGYTRSGTWDLGAYEYGAGLPTSVTGCNLVGATLK